MRNSTKLLLGLLPGLRLGGGGGWTPVYLLRDDFVTDEAAPLASPRACEPGPGTLTLVQTDGQFSVSSGKLNFPAGTTPAWGDQGFYGGSVSRIAGRAAISRINRPSVAGTVFPLLWGDSADANIEDTTSRLGLLMFSVNLEAFAHNASSLNVGTVTAATDYDVAVVLRGSGAFFFVRGGAYTSWTLVWVDAASTFATLYPKMANNNSAGTLDTFRVLDLPAPFDDDYGLATQRLAGNVAQGTTFGHEADCVIEYTETTLLSSDTQLLSFRRQDANNRWDIVAASNGNIGLNEVVAGVSTSRGSASGVLASGHRIVVVCDGPTIRVYSNNVLRITYSSAANFATATQGTLNSLGTGGAVSDLITWPRYLTGQAAAILDKAVA